MSNNHPAWFVAWAIHHLTTFGIKTTDSMNAFLSWYNLFSQFGYTDAELRTATVAMLNSSQPPARIMDHFYAIKKAIGIDRNTRREREAESVEGKDFGRCVDCNETGIVSVPHPDYADPHGWEPVKHNTAGDPIYATLGVTCKCHRGNQIHNAQLSRVVEKKLKAASMTLIEYEQSNYIWRRQIADEYERRKQSLAIESTLTMPTLMKLLDTNFKGPK